MVAFDKIREFLNHLKKNRIGYYVFGGFAISGLMGSLQREHRDVDVMILEEDKSKFIDSLKSKWDFYWDNNLLKIDDKGLKVDVLFLKDLKDYIKVIGNKGDTIVPKQFFNNKTKGKIDGFEFDIIPLEWLVQNILFFDNEVDRTNLMLWRNKINLKLLDTIKDKTKRSETDPKLKEYEKRKKELGLT